MGHAVNLVVSCSNRKRYETAPGLAVRELVGSDVRARLQTWRERIRTAQAEEYPATELYIGEHWSVVPGHSFGRIRSRLERATLDLLSWIWPHSTKYTDQVIPGDVRFGNRRFGCEGPDWPKGRPSLVDRCVLLFISGETTLSPVFRGPRSRLSAHAVNRRTFGRLSVCQLRGTSLSSPPAFLLSTLFVHFDNFVPVRIANTAVGTIICCPFAVWRTLGEPGRDFHFMLNARVARFSVFGFHAHAGPTVDHLAALVQGPSRNG